MVRDIGGKVSIRRSQMVMKSGTSDTGKSTTWKKEISFSMIKTEFCMP
jgi:hypothetical protein